MAELIRSFTKRAVEILSPNNISTFGIQSHPENYQSAQFRNWLSLCRENKVDQLKTDMTNYLRSPESIKKIKDLGKEWTTAIPSFLSFGKEINKEKSYQIISDSKLESVFGKNRSVFADKRMAVADTILCLAHLKNLSNVSNIDYLSVLKIMSFVERCFDFKMKLPELNIYSHFEKPILLPSCFSKIDPCDKILTTTHFSFLEDTNIKVRAGEKIIKGCISDDDCNCKVNDVCVEQSHCCAKPRIDVIDLMIVKDYTKCYQAGDLSFIKNVLEGETLSTTHRRLERTEELVETEEDIRTFEEKYLQSEEKASLQKETEKIVKQDSAFDAGMTASADWGTYKIDAQANYSSSQSKAQTNKDIVNSSKEIIDRATKQVEEKVRKLVSTKRIFETEERNKHSFVNTAGPNISGQYLYVNKVSRAQVYNYGRKAVIDIILPEPASLYKRLFENKYQGAKPTEPTPIVIDPKTITPENYKTLITQYGLKDVPQPPDFYTEIEINLEGEPGDPRGKEKSGSRIFNFNCSIPTNYVGTEMSVASRRLNYNADGGISISANIGNASVWHSHQQNDAYSYNSLLPSIEGTRIVAVHTFDVTNFTWLLTVKCVLKEEFKTEWRTGVYSKITEVNEKALEKYDKAFAEYQKAKEEFDIKEAELKKERYNKNPFINRETEKEELKRMVISYISCQFFDQFDAMKNKVKPCGYPEINIREAEQEGKFIQFFEQAFNWNLITYIFYPYFWGRKCTWADKHKDESNDLIFEKFLAAGSCRVLIPIRDGYFDYVSYFLSHGEIWGGNGTPPMPNDPHYVSLAQEIKEQKQNFNADREGSIDATNASPTVILNNSDYYWDFGTPAIPATVGPLPTPAIPAIPAGLNQLNIDSDLDREIIIDCKIYRIVDIQLNPPSSTAFTSWIITLDRNYEGDTNTNMKWSTGAVFVGAPWEFITPTTLTFLRDKSSCLPCYPLKECKEA